MWHPDPDRLALAALPAETPDPQVGEHLAGCAMCRGHVDALRRTVDLAREGEDAVDDGRPPPERVWRAITDELEIVAPPPAAARPRRRRFVLPAAAAVLGLVVGVAAGLGLGSSGSTEQEGVLVARLVAVDGAAPGSGDVAMTDTGGETRMQVAVQGVGGLEGADYLEVWLLDPAQGRVISVGALSGQGTEYRGTFTVPAGLPTGAYTTVDVSAERWDGDPTHSARSILRGQLA